MINERFICGRDGCEVEGVKTTHNQKYCSSDCCRIATNAKIMQKYHEKVAIKKGKKRQCKICGTALSRYNDSKVCGGCQTTAKKQNSGDATALVSSVKWLT